MNVKEPILWTKGSSARGLFPLPISAYEKITKKTNKQTTNKSIIIIEWTIYKCYILLWLLESSIQISCTYDPWRAYANFVISMQMRANATWRFTRHRVMFLGKNQNEDSRETQTSQFVLWLRKVLIWRRKEKRNKNLSSHCHHWQCDE